MASERRVARFSQLSGVTLLYDVIILIDECLKLFYIYKA